MPKKVLEMKKYKFRAECTQDVINLALLLDGKDVESLTIKTMSIGSDVEAVIISNIPYMDIIEMMRQVSDGHVMAQTIKPIQEYTGERNYQMN